MRRANVIPVPGVVVTGQLPVRLDPPFVNTRDEFRSALVSIKNEIHVPAHIPEIIQQAHRIRIKSRKEQPIVLVDLGGTDQSALTDGQRLVVALLLFRYYQQLCCQVIGQGGL